MKKVCPVCQTTLKTNCFIKDNGISTLSYLELIIKDDDFKKTNYELKSCYCPNCGHVEFFVDLNNPEFHYFTSINSYFSISLTYILLCFSYILN